MADSSPPPRKAPSRQSRSSSGATGRRPPPLSKPRPSKPRVAGPAARTTPSGDRPPAVLAGAVAAATVCALVLLYYSGPAANLSGFLVGAVGGPLLLVGFLVALERRQAGGRFGDWRWLGSRQAMSARGRLMYCTTESNTESNTEIIRNCCYVVEGTPRVILSAGATPPKGKTETRLPECVAGLVSVSLFDRPRRSLITIPPSVLPLQAPS